MAYDEPPKYVPEDIFIVIFHRLPIRSLGVCRCVCKTWHHIIATPYFVKTHLAHQNKCILYRTERLCTLLDGSQSIFDATLNHSKFYCPRLILDNYEGTYFTKRSRTHGICNGLLCLSAYKYDIGDHIYLWNPTCRKIKKLPELDKCIKDEIGFTWKACLSFGYYDEDCKVIVIAPVGKVYIVCVYSLSTNSWNFIRTDSWNTIQTEVPYDTFVNKRGKYSRVKETKFVAGTVYMIESDHVRCFDLSTEIIRLISFPIEFRPYFGNGYYDFSNEFRNATVYSLAGEFDDYREGFTCEAYGETIAIFGFGYYWSPSLTMWILRDKSSFTPVWVASKEQAGWNFCHPVGFLKNGRYLIRPDRGKRKFFSCNLGNPKLCEALSVRGSPYIKGRIHSNHVESLLLLDEDNLDPIDFYNIDGQSLSES